MRHVILLTVATLLLATITWSAYQFDLSRQQSRHDDIAQQISQDALKLEQQYFNHARTLIALLDPHDTLLVQIESAQSSLAAMPSISEREPVFQDLVSRIQTRLLFVPISGRQDQSQNDARLQEWRRITDQMNGALNRREQLLHRPDAAN